VRLLERLQRRGHRVLFFCRDDSVAEQARALGVPAEVAHLGGHASVHHAVGFARQLRRHRPDALLLGTFKKSWLGALGGRLAAVPRVIARIGLETDLPSRGPFYRIAFARWVDRVVVNARALRGAVLASLPRLDPERVVLVWNGVEEPVRRHSPGALRAQLGIPPGAPVPRRRRCAAACARWGLPSASFSSDTVSRSATCSMRWTSSPSPRAPKG